MFIHYIVLYITRLCLLDALPQCVEWEDVNKRKCYTLNFMNIRILRCTNITIRLMSAYLLVPGQKNNWG